MRNAIIYTCLKIFLQRSAKYTPYYAVFGRHPRAPGVINITKEEGDDRCVVSEEIEEHLEANTAEFADLHAKVMTKRKYICIIT